MKTVALIRALRPHQWLKNLLVFLPAIAGHRIAEAGVLTAAVLAFVTLSMAASAGYIANDLLDLDSDRRHPRKRNRPFASGSASVTSGIVLGVLLLGLSVALAGTLSLQFLIAVCIYLVGTISYSTWLKRKAIVDVLTLAGLYTLRILAGSAATGVPTSFWLLALSMFFFLDLACIKRYVELSSVQPEGDARVPGRGYGAVDRETIFAMGTGCGLMSVLVLALYINSPDIQNLYPSPWMLWGLCPLLLYWTSRMWILARRGLVHDDPLVFALRDRIGLLAGACAAVLLWLGARVWDGPFHLLSH